MRVGYVVKRYPRYSETFIVNEILAHEASGLELEIFSVRPPVDTHFQDRISAVRAPVHYLRASGLRASELWRMLGRARRELPNFEPGLARAWNAEAGELYGALELALAVQETGIEHLHAHFATSPTSVARLAAGFAGISFSFTAHAKDIFHEDVKVEQLGEFMSDAAAVITVSHYNQGHLRELVPGAAQRIVRVYNGLELADFRFDSPREREPRILAVGRLVEKKGFGDLVEACALLRADGVRFRCDLVGTGPLEDELRARVEALGLAGLVTLTGPRPQAEVRRMLHGAAVFAAPCVVGRDGDADGLPTTLLEAMASGLPCISTDVTGIPEVIEPEQTGLRVPQHDPPALAKALARLLDSPDDRERLARAARARIERDFDVSQNAARLRDVFRAAAWFGARQESTG